ncbi:MFS general substrate transporter [Massarina eburnea CBS 473.64]|uniref:MFS general substrate transporter n=1 Tax=Massarina eburnea CBS 473.64 TaxID=1395130 RepID=A0A6A6SF57_9PLEO|nr:MFS general substrate transporter [Massarina eburnea CBS 473.64]
MTQYQPVAMELQETNRSSAAMELQETNRSSDSEIETGITKTSEDAEVDLPLREAFHQYSKVSWWVIGLSTVIVLWGYDLAVVGAVASLEPFQRDFGVFDKMEDGKEKWIIPTIWLSLWQSFPAVGQLIGALAAGPMMDRIGRKKCILIGAIMVSVSVLIEFLANKVQTIDGMRGAFLAGKIVQGCATALIKMASMTWVSETVPTCLRGPSMVVFPACNLIGQFIASVVVFGLSGITTDMGYLIALSVQWVFSAAPFVVAFLLPESPAYLVRSKRMGEAKTNVERLFAPKNDTDAIFEKLRLSIEEEERSNEGISYVTCFKGANLRRTWIVIFANLLPPLFGLPLISSASYFLQQVGMKSSHSLMFLIAGIIVGFLGNLGSTWTLSRLGRRRLTITTLLIAAVIWGAVGVSGIFTAYHITQWVIAGFFMTIVFVCGVGVWSTSYAIMSEVSSLRLRAKSQSIGGIAAYIAAIFTNFVLPYLYNPDSLDLKGKTGFIFAATCFIAAAATYMVVPEMRGRSPIEIDHLFEEKVSARKSTRWQDLSPEARAAAL